jgi:hypothetical protein
MLFEFVARSGLFEMKFSNVYAWLSCNNTMLFLDPDLHAFTFDMWHAWQLVGVIFAKKWTTSSYISSYVYNELNH